MTAYSDADRAAVYRVIAERRDMRHFRADPIAPELLTRLLQAAHYGPSVGFMQPWRFIRITDRGVRAQLKALVEDERVRTAASLGPRHDEFMRLKVEGIAECGEVLVAVLMDKRELHRFGRRTMPEMDLASVACAIQNLWLAARAEGIGMGWVSLYDPQRLARLMQLPAGASTVGILCLGHVDHFYAQPMLEQQQWAQRADLHTMLHENHWPQAAPSSGAHGKAQIELVLGGARSGKSRYALERGRAVGDPVTWVVTCEVRDEEMRTRVERHRAERPTHWATVEAPLALAEAIRSLPDTFVVVDCLTLWLSNWLCSDDEPGWVAARNAFLEAVAARRAPLLLVSNEVGYGIVPDNALARRFRDEAGLLHQQIAAIVPRVVLVVAGQAQVIKEATAAASPRAPAPAPLAVVADARLPRPTDWWHAPVQPIHEAPRDAAAQRQRELTKPAGALGDLEILAIRIAGLQGCAQPELVRPWISIFAADHGISREGVSAYPREVTGQMVANFAHGGAAICVLARQIGANIEVVDTGVAAETDGLPQVVQAKTAAGTANFLESPAMTPEGLQFALQAGRDAVARAVAAGTDCFIGGEMGIGNTTSATALACVWLGTNAASLAGPGTGLDAAGVARKAQLIQRGLDLHRARDAQAIEVLAALGGFEIAALAGAYIAAAQIGVPVLVDGFISSVAALAACKLNPGVRDWLLFGHVSAEPAHAKVLAELDAKPVLQLGLRLGEASGAATAFPILQLACALHSRMATFAEAGVSTRSS